MMSNTPIKIGPHAEILKIEDWKESSVIDDLLDFIKVNGVVDVHDITMYLVDNNSTDRTLKSILTDLNTASLDLTYQAKNIDGGKQSLPRRSRR